MIVCDCGGMVFIAVFPSALFPWLFFPRVYLQTAAVRMVLANTSTNNAVLVCWWLCYDLVVMKSTC